jgi:hypothetical protein
MNSMSQVKLQIPMDKSVRDGLEKRAKDLGFDSAQAYIRFWAKAQADGRSYYLGEPEQMTPEMEKIAEDAMREIAAGDVSPAFDNAQDAIDYLDNIR